VQVRGDASLATISKQMKFVFPPGHRIGIMDFINSVRSKCAVTGKKRSSSSTFAAKKPKELETDEATTTNERAQTTYDLKEIADDV